MHISVTLLCGNGKRLSPYAVRTQVPVVGWLHYEVKTHGPYEYEKVEARLLSEEGQVLLTLDKARLLASRGQQGALIEGVEYRAKGSKHSICDVQQWWCESPPRTRALLDKEARILAAERAYEKVKAAGWGYD